MRKKTSFLILLLLLLLLSCGNYRVAKINPTPATQLSPYEQNQKNHPNFLMDSTHTYPALTSPLLLVTPTFRLNQNEVPTTLVVVEQIDYIIRKDYPMLIDESLVKPLYSLFQKAREQGISLTLFSGYRSYDYQAELYEKSHHSSYVAMPGASEHQTGLAVDISTRDIGLTSNLENTKVGNFLVNEATQYGFILRYPKSKESITKYSYEPWHLRYVGCDIAAIIKQNNWTLEEYFYHMVVLNY
jgi:D-alanyl-D-alanine carboxypeptidase